MALFDLADVTRTIINLIEVALVNTKHWTIGSEPKVYADLPNRVKKDGLGIYLFHVQESNHFKNLPAPGKDQPPASYIPMGLNLFYQLSANNNEEDGSGPLQEQLLMGIAMKALHDNPEVADTVPDGNKNRFKITLQTLAPNEAVQYWTAGESPVKLSAFYEVSVIFLEPKEATSYAGRVLSYANYIFVQGAPRLTGSENMIEYRLPGDPVIRQVKITPAQAPPAHPVPVPPNLLTPPIDSEIKFSGHSFGGGNLDLLLINPRWPEPATATAWPVTMSAANQVQTTIQETALLRDSLVPVTIFPGLYAAQVTVTEHRTLPDAAIKEFRHVSNQFPFSVMPRIDTITTGAGGLFTVTGFLFQHPDLDQENIQVYVGEKRMLFNTGGPFGASEFRITGVDTLELIVPAGLTGETVPLRIMINGVESPPNWIKVP